MHALAYSESRLGLGEPILRLFGEIRRCKRSPIQRAGSLAYSESWLSRLFRELD